MAIKLSAPGKMPCPSWSLQAIDTCPGSINPDTGQLVDACAICYATDGNYRFKSVRAVREHNRQDWHRRGWTLDMSAAIKKLSYFRWFDSGDMYDKKLAIKILNIAKNCESTKFWLPTRMYKFRKWESLLSEMDSIPNLVVRKSGDAVDGTIIAGKNTSTIFDPAGDPPAGAYVCPAYGQGGKCLDCRACWDKEIQVIAYPQHGRKAKAYSANIIARSA